MDSYKLNIPPMTVHFVAKYPMRRKPVLAVSFEGESRLYKVALFNDEVTFKWFIECLEDALVQANVRRFQMEVD